MGKIMTKNYELESSHQNIVHKAHAHLLSLADPLPFAGPRARSRLQLHVAQI